MERDPKRLPSYSITSVDHALRIAAMLQLEGSLGVSQVAERLGVARSTAHRLLSMLVYRDFATQGEDRLYRPGPILEIGGHSSDRTARLRGLAMPHLERLSAVTGESAHLSVRTGRIVRIVASVESSQALRVGSREGMVFPAHISAGGRALLADLEPDELSALYADASNPDGVGLVDLGRLREELEVVRANGFGINVERTERGVVVLGTVVRDPDGRSVAAVLLGLPALRHTADGLPALVTALRGAAADLERDLRASGSAA